VESFLSGVTKPVGTDSFLWYKKNIYLPAEFKKKNLLLHFGAVDWQCIVYVNGQIAGMHEGGYDPFTLNITPFIKKNGQQEIVVRVWDPSDDGPQPRGKQVKIPRSIWYTSVTGIWQTVWLESVPPTYIASIKQTPDIDKNTITVSAQLHNMQADDLIKISAWDENKKIDEQLVAGNNAATLKIEDLKIWSPDNPFLYDLTIMLIRKGKMIDSVRSYFAMRKISMAPDNNGVQRIMLNNKFLFEFGPLDQGWWPDGLYTAPTDDALKFDIEKTKEMGFNLIRKHVKVEPARWYNYCDKLGMLVWQDMPSGDLKDEHWESKPGVESGPLDKIRTTASENIFKKEWSAIIDALYNFPCIIVWVPFNEAWGQFKTPEITAWTMQKDPSRLVNSASGGNFHFVGHMVDLHNYPAPAMPRADLFGSKHALVLGEFGGLGLPVENHTWQNKNNWGYQSFKNVDTLFLKYQSFVNTLNDWIIKGLSAAIYTQTTDVEIEVNGFMTYDRKVIKMPVEKLNAVNSKLYNTSLVNILK
ncbi:MAG: sugar-binding domain-containing protein, partial [Saprospiraceae bacterium]